MNSAKIPKCTGCETPENGEKFIRGQCSACYQATRRAIRNGEITDRQAVKRGLLLPAKKAGRPPTNPVTVELKK